MQSKPIQVLLIEDDPMVQEVNRQFVEQVDGFRIAGIAGTGVEGMAKIRELAPDLAILDIYMPQQDGIETLTQIRREQLPVDIMIISAANDQRTIGRMLQYGAVDYIMKPFKFERVKQALERYRQMKQGLTSSDTLSQHELDRMLSRHAGRAPETAPVSAADSAVFAHRGEQAPEQLPKGLQAGTMRQILQYMTGQPEPLSAEEVAEGVGIARVTARRYLDYLEKSGKVRIDLQYGVGRPVNKYMLSS
ncbi:response regulator [Paenibacillus doosanensis]|uniref:response regulator n=1 Tax=Paenibacillus doosanensis TaxID=1229154 RepID=UPI00218040E1|nr:response regulator [Paenibacillus doosanensis]MCS7460724.1 response regulator [Paenibacillus doosanensis]